ncbi:ABC transporter ATP-binding protein [Peribacillus frigoritolerans]|uniref:ABC transporter ATP-binding protein n=1 Tax=Peribacillus frigoritolerans TaxID=450367 RepID=UPI00105A51AC|nr:ABC transporter ATP-binding protein [Peribacillus frigoritolerans]TDL82399.1 ABC transporter ATP-binding protein [Peribacillus frigoritolerans]
MSFIFENVRKIYRTGEVEVPALNDVSIACGKGEIIVILGPSGSGKSTFLNVAGGIDRADGGQVTVQGENLHEMNDRQLTLFRRKHAGFIFQSYNLISALTVRENVETGADISDHPLSPDEILDKVGMSEHQHKFPHQLSGGEQQRTAIARAIVKNPSILFCDEPTGALDEETGKKILSLIQEINVIYGTTILMITHNPGIADMAHTVMKMKSGKIIETVKNEAPIPAEQVKWV